MWSLLSLLDDSSRDEDTKKPEGVGPLAVDAKGGQASSVLPEVQVVFVVFSARLLTLGSPL